MAIDRTTKQTSLVGAIIGWSTATAPNGWLVCNGSAISRTNYADLFALVGTKFGVGDGSTTFNVPNLSSRSAAGVSAANSIGQTDFATTGGPSSTNTGNASALHVHDTSNTGNIDTDHSHSFWQGGATLVSPTEDTLHYHGMLNMNTESANHTHTLSSHTHTNPDITTNYIIKY